MKARIPVQNQDTLAALRGFLRRLLETETVEAVLVPMETPSGAVTPALVTDPALLDAADPLAPVLGLNSARVVGPVTVREPRGGWRLSCAPASTARWWNWSNSSRPAWRTW